MESEPVCEFTICEIGQIKGINTFKFKFYMQLWPDCRSDYIIVSRRCLSACSTKHSNVSFPINDVSLSEVWEKYQIREYNFLGKKDE